MMIAIRKAWWATALLAAFAGCNSEEPTGTVPPPPAAPGGPAPGEAAPAPEKPAEEKAKDEAAPAKTEEPAKKDEAAPPAEPPKKDEAAEKKSAAAATLNAKELAAINELPADEKAVALKQILCPVSGGHLGAMGKPFKISAEGKTFYLCCDGCEEDVKEHPKDVVAKLNAK